LKLASLDQASQRARAINRSLDAMTKSTNGFLVTSRNLFAFGATYLGVTEGWDATFSAAAKSQSAMTEPA